MKHGMASTIIYRKWKNIKSRCYNPNDPHYPRWGGRGIEMYQPWKSDFMEFYEYVSNLPHYAEKGYSLDRINNDKGYEPNNLRWATLQEQNNNTRTNRYWTWNGETHTTAEWSRIVNISARVLKDRLLKLGWTVEDALTTPLMTRKEWSNRTSNAKGNKELAIKYHENKKYKEVNE